jgi:CRISPR-associated protein Cas5 subtype I-B
MKALQLKIDGNWAHFKKPETNNNPLTHDFITKTALIGLIGAVLGIERKEMRKLFPQLSEDLLYGVEIINAVKKESWGFTLRKAVNLFEKAPKNMEFIKKPVYLVSIGLLKERSERIFNQFVRSVKDSEAKYTPVLGLHNCPANLEYLSDGEFSEKENGKFTAKCFVSIKHILDMSPTRTFRIGLDKVPTFQNDDFWNLPEYYREVIYPSGGNELVVQGEYYKYIKDGRCWWLI